MSSIFWGFFLVLVNFNLTVNGHVLNLLPPFAGYLLVMRGCRELEGESDLFAPIRPFAMGMSVYTGILWLGDLLALTGQGSWLSVLLGLASMAVSLYVAWAVVGAIRDMEVRRNTELNSGSLKTAWTVLAVAEIAVYLLGILGSLLALLGLAAGTESDGDSFMDARIPELADMVLSLGGGTVTTPECATMVRERSFCIYLRASVETLVKNLQNDFESRPMLGKGGGQPSDLAALRSRIEELMALRKDIYESCAHLIIDIDSLSFEETASIIAEKIPK